VKVEVKIKCELRQLSIRIIPPSNSNYLVQCFQSGCSGGSYSSKTRIVTFDIVFDHSKHAGKQLLIELTCPDEPEDIEEYQLNPCGKL
jgi:hypothetical protein